MKKADNNINFIFFVQALLRIGRWIEETAHYAANRAIQQYKVMWCLSLGFNE